MGWTSGQFTRGVTEGEGLRASPQCPTRPVGELRLHAQLSRGDGTTSTHPPTVVLPHHWPLHFNSTSVVRDGHTRRIPTTCRISSSTLVFVDVVHSRCRLSSLIACTVRGPLTSSTMAQLRAGGNRCIGILREVKSKWERRTPLIPSDVASLTSSGIRVLIQPSSLRIFTDSEFKSLPVLRPHRRPLPRLSASSASKKFPPSSLLPHHSYLLFSHTIKAQPGQHALPRRRQPAPESASSTTKPSARVTNKRLVAFGQYAGMAGMIDGLRGVGERLLSQRDEHTIHGRGVRVHVSGPSTAAAKRAVKECGDEIRRVGLPTAGRSPSRSCSLGQRECHYRAPSVHLQFPPSSRRVTPARTVVPRPLTHHLLYSTTSRHAEDLVRAPHASSLQPAPTTTPTPLSITPTFHSHVSHPYTSLLVNGMYWDPRFPRLLTLPPVARPPGPQGAKLLAVADVSCDVGRGGGVPEAGDDRH